MIDAALMMLIILAAMGITFVCLIVLMLLFWLDTGDSPCHWE